MIGVYYIIMYVTTSLNSTRSMVDKQVLYDKIKGKQDVSTKSRLV